jgi:hypothetical protein
MPLYLRKFRDAKVRCPFARGRELTLRGQTRIKTTVVSLALTRVRRDEVSSISGTLDLCLLLGLGIRKAI